MGVQRRTSVLAMALIASAMLYAVQPAAAEEDSAPASPSAAEAAGLSKEQVEEIVRDYLLANPEIVMQAMERHRENERIAEVARREAAMEAMAARIFENPEAPDNGVTDYDVTLVEFFDYQCHYCKKVFSDLVAVMEADPKLRVVFKELPILGPESTIAARAALASRKQGKYLEFHIELMDMRGPLTEDRVYRTAESLGLDVEKLKADMYAPEIGRMLRENMEIAQQIGVNGTPAMLVGRRFVPGAVDRATMERLIESARADNS